MMNATLTMTTRDSTGTGSRERPSARILLVTHGYPPHQTGGAEAQAQRKARWWAARGDEVRVLAADTAADADLPFDTIEQANDRDGRITIRRLRFRAPDGTRPFRETFDNKLLVPEVERELDTFHPDLVYQVSGYLFGLAPLQLAAVRGIPTVLFAMDFWDACPRLTLLRPDGACCPGPRHPADCAACRMADRPSVQHLPLVAKAAWQTFALAGHVLAIGQRFDVPTFAERQAAVRAALASVSLVVVNSHFLAGQLQRLGVPDDRLLIIRQGLDCDDLPAKRPARDAGDPLRVLFLGQITWHKGVDLAAEAVRELAGRGHAIQLRIHGQPTGDAAYRARIAAFGASPSIDIGEPLGRRELMQALHDSDVLVVPSRWYENSPNVILEAFAAGLPVVVAGHGGMAEMVRDGIDGLRFRPGDVSSLAGALHRLCDEAGLLERLRAGVRPPATIDAEMRAEEPALASVMESSM
jgi:glycosyltransferase involved in cell wall biosynthesis